MSPSLGLGPVDPWEATMTIPSRIVGHHETRIDMIAVTILGRHAAIVNTK